MTEDLPGLAKYPEAQRGGVETWQVYRNMMQDLIDRAAGVLRNAQHAVALTGAGISTPSGIPDFRSPGNGVWSTSIR